MSPPIPSSEALSRTLCASGFEVRAVVPDGDCFYECVHQQLPLSGRPDNLANVKAMRDLVADKITQELFDLYRMFAEAGVDEFAWMRGRHAPRDLESLRSFARVCGRECGAGGCLWADQHAIETVAQAADVQILIVDEQALGARRRQRDRNDALRRDGRFVAVGPPSVDRCLLLHRSSRAHYSPVFYHGKGVVALSQLPSETRALWPARNEDAEAVPVQGCNRTTDGMANRVPVTHSTAKDTSSSSHAFDHPHSTEAKQHDAAGAKKQRTG